MVKVTLKDGTVVEGTSEEIYALDLFVETDVVESVVSEVEGYAPMKVGEYAVVLKSGIGGADVFTPWQIVKVTFVKDSVGNVLRPMVKSLDGQHEWHMTIGEEIRKADVGDITEARVIYLNRTNVFKGNGRKVNEYRRGDIVHDGTNSAHFTVISDYSLETGKVVFYTHDKIITIPIEEVKPVVFAESRLDRK